MKPILRYTPLLLAFNLSLLLLYACSAPERKRENNATGEVSTAATTGCSGTENTQLDRFDTLNVLVETSGSMAGFMPTSGSQTNFQRVLDNILANAEAENAATLQLFSAGENIKTLSLPKFREMLRQGLKETTASTALPNLIKQVAAKHTGLGQVSLFVSDFIYAPPKSTDRDYISTDIRRALQAVKAKGLAVSVYAFQSKFNGTYYPAGAKSGGSGQPLRNCCETELPFYIWAIGSEAGLNRVNSKLMNNLSYEIIDLGFTRTDPVYGLMPGAGRGGNWYLLNPQQPTITIDNTREASSGEMQFTVGFNTQQLPHQFARQAYLEENLKLKVNNGSAEISEIRNKSDFESAGRLSSRDKALLDCYTYYVTVKVNKLDNRNQPLTINLQLDQQLPLWIEEWTTEDDRRPEESGAKTFALNDIMKGVQNLYVSSQSNWFSLPVTIQKAQ